MVAWKTCYHGSQLSRKGWQTCLVPSLGLMQARATYLAAEDAGATTRML
jgi:hypothetical protein